MSARHTLLELFDAALRGQVGDCAIFAVGKAASAMALGAHDALGSKIAQTLVVTKDGHADPDLARLGAVTILETAHPYPDERSLAAGAELEQRLARLDSGLYPIFLISGGSSSLVESLHEGVTLAEELVQLED